VVLQPCKLTSFLLAAPSHFLMGAPNWVPQNKDASMFYVPHHMRAGLWPELRFTDSMLMVVSG
jgi:hypothetical protein